ncbi:MAG: dihydroneopterin aldolase, partial [Mucinivorans sp.]
MAIIKLDNMQFYSSHGCYVQEQRVGGRFEVNLTVEYDSKAAERSDDVSQTVNYLALYDCVRTQMAITSH